MSAHFYDSSAFAKLFVQEAGTAGMLQLYRDASKRIVSQVAFVEVHSAIRRRERCGDLSKAHADQACTLLQAEVQRVHTVEFSTQITSMARDVLDKHNLRSLDAIQLASALLSLSELSEPITFVTSDTRLAGTALAVSFAVVDPISVQP